MLLAAHSCKSRRECGHGMLRKMAALNETLKAHGTMTWILWREKYVERWRGDTQEFSCTYEKGVQRVEERERERREM